VAHFGVVDAVFSSGVWKYDNGWTQLTSATTSTYALDAYGGFTGDFNGTWRWSGGSWKQLSGTNATLLASDDDGNIAGTYSSGLWEYNSNGWVQLTGATATQIAIV
jgi:hypothetical protein